MTTYKNTGMKNNSILHSVRRTIEETRIERYDYEEYQKGKLPTAEELQRQKNMSFDYEPLISVITQIGTQPVKYLDKMIESIINQTYSSFELCIADNSNSDEASSVIARYIVKYPNIRYVRTKSINKKGDNLNETLNMAAGDYVIYVRPNDELSPHALFELVKAVNRRERVDVVYADEDRISLSGQRYDRPIFKPNINYDLLRTNNYIGNPMMVRKNLARRIGGYSDRFEGAQEYDFVLRCIEGSDKINHVSKMLYHNRDVGDIDDDVEAMVGALRAHFNRIGIMANIYSLDSPGYFRINYHMESTPHITIVINDVGTDKQLKKCIDSIHSRTIYSEYDIIVRKYGSKLHPDQIDGSYIIALDSDMVVVSNNFIEKMIERISQDDVSVVCAKIISKSKKVIHAGIRLVKGKPKYMFEGMPAWQYGYCLRAILQQNVDAFPASGIILKKEDYLQIKYDNLEDGIDLNICEKLKERGKPFSYEPNVLFQKDR